MERCALTRLYAPARAGGLTQDGTHVHSLPKSPPLDPSMQSFRFTPYFEEVVLRKRPYLRVVTLDDKITIHNAFPDRGFRL